MTSNSPADEFADLLAAQLTGAAQPEPAEPVPVSRVPQPNPAQGSSGLHNPSPDPNAGRQAFEDRILEILNRNDIGHGGWMPLDPTQSL